MGPLRLLMVDDDWMDVEILEEFLEEFLEESDLDFELDHAADGIETLQEIRKDRRLWKLAVLIYTTSQQDQDKAQAFEGRANYFITKPTEPGEYAELVQFLKDFQAQYLQKE